MLADEAVVGFLANSLKLHNIDSRTDADVGCHGNEEGGRQSDRGGGGEKEDPYYLSKPLKELWAPWGRCQACQSGGAALEPLSALRSRKVGRRRIRADGERKFCSELAKSACSFAGLKRHS